MHRILFRDAQIWDVSGVPAFPVDLLVEGNGIKTISRQPGALSEEGATVIEARGRTLMPGLVVGNTHLTFGAAVDSSDLGNIPPEEHELLTKRNAKILLDQGFSSAYGAGTSKLPLDVDIPKEVNAGRLADSRIRAASLRSASSTTSRTSESTICTTRASASSPMAWWKSPAPCALSAGRDWITSKSTSRVTTSVPRPMREEEVAMFGAVAGHFNKKVNCHARSAEAVKRAVRNGVDVIYHCESADEEGIELLESVPTPATSD